MLPGLTKELAKTRRDYDAVVRRSNAHMCKVSELQRALAKAKATSDSAAQVASLSGKLLEKDKQLKEGKRTLLSSTRAWLDEARNERTTLSDKLREKTTNSRN